MSSLPFDAYDAFLIDLWGVVHDGHVLYPGVAETLAALAHAGKRIIFLSNAPRRAEKAEAILTQLGIAPNHYDHLLTSGECAYQQLRTEQPRPYYYLGPSKDEDILDDLPYPSVAPEAAAFILCTGFAYDFQPEEEIRPLLADLAALSLPMLCVNPDVEVVRQDGTYQLCAGWVAEAYAALGGAVDYIGKPYPAVYDACFALLRDIPKPRILAIGDNLLTDIKGANHAGIDAALITGGILKFTEPTPLPAHRLQALIETTGAKPTYVAQGLGNSLT